MKKVYILAPLVLFSIISLEYLQFTSRVETAIEPILPVHRVVAEIPRVAEPINTEPDITKQKSELELRNIKLVGFPDYLVGRVYHVYSLVPEAKNLTLKYQPKYFFCAGLKVVLGCLTVETRVIQITDKITESFWSTVSSSLDRKAGFEFILLHETAHSLGIIPEQEADNFAYELIK